MIKIRGKTMPRVRDTSRVLARVDPSTVAQALGAEPTETPGPGVQGPVALFGLRQALAARLRSTGGRPSLGVSRRQKIPLDESDWQRLCQLAEALADEDSRPTPGQVASELLRERLGQLLATEEAHRTEGEETGDLLNRYLDEASNALDRLREALAPAPEVEHHLQQIRDALDRLGSEQTRRRLALARGAAATG